MSNFMKIHPVGAELLHAENRRADTTKLIVAFRNFTKAREIEWHWKWRNLKYRILTYLPK
jgi:hypothetical protein